MNKAALAVSLFLAALRVEAQVDSNLLREEWSPDNHWVESFDKPFYVFRGDVDHGGNRYGVFHWDSFGRFKLDRTDAHPTAWGGYKILTMDLSSQDKFLDHGFYDIGLAAGGKLGSLGDAWTLEVAGGVATANDGHFTNTEAIYPTATILAQRALGAREFLQLGVTYDGNSALLPALPLPLVEYEAVLGPSWRLRAGFPHAEAEYRPIPEASLLLIAEYPTDFRFHGEVEAGGGFRFFAECTRRIDGFHLDDAGRERGFYRLHTAEAGIRFVTSWIDVSLSGGYAFRQQYFTGYDLRERDQIGHPHDRPMIALTVQGTF